MSVPALWRGMRKIREARAPLGERLREAIYSTNTMPQAADQEKTDRSDFV
jgi:hypothetical protein